MSFRRVGFLGPIIVVRVFPYANYSQLNDKNIWEYDAVLKTADGHDVPLQFNTMSAAIYPIQNAILIPPENEMFVVKRCRSGSYSGL